MLLLKYVVSKGAPKDTGTSLSGAKNKENTVAPESQSGYDEKLIVDGITRSQKALEGFRSRLDIHFAIVGAAERIGRWDIVGTQLNRILEDSMRIDNQWVWGPVNLLDGDPKTIMLQNVTYKTSDLFKANTKQADKVLKNVSETLVTLYPKEIYGYANLGTLCLAQQDYECAEKYFKQALKIDPQDKIVLRNLEKVKAMRK